MTKITDLEANLEQYKIDQAALHSEAAEQRALLKETIDKNKVDADRQFAEIMNVLKTLQPPTNTTPLTTLQPPTTTLPATLPPFHHNQQPFSYPTMPLQQSYTTTTPPPPTFALTQPLLAQQQPQPTLPSSAAYTSFSGLRFDSQGFPIPYGSNGEFFGPFQTGEHSSHNRWPPVRTEGMFQNFSDVSMVNTGTFFPGPNQT